MSQWFSLESTSSTGLTTSAVDTAGSTEVDQWIDVKTKEDVLKEELNKTKDDLKKRQSRLDETSLQVDLLKGYKTNLETEKTTLQAQLQQKNNDVAMKDKSIQELQGKKDLVAQELVSLKTTLTAENRKLEHSLALSKNEIETGYRKINDLTLQLSALQQQKDVHESTSNERITTLTTLVEDLQLKVSSMERQSIKEQMKLKESQQFLVEANREKELLRADMMKGQDTMKMQSQKLQEANTKIGQVSVLADELRHGKFELERTLKMKESALATAGKELEQSRQREAALANQLEELKEMSNEQIVELQDSLNSKMESLQDATDRLEYMQAVVSGYQTQHDVLEQNLSAVREQLQREESKNRNYSESNHSMELTLKQQELRYMDELAKVKMEYHDKIMELQDKLQLQQISFTRRLHDVRNILGEGLFGGPAKNPWLELAKSASFGHSVVTTSSSMSSVVPQPPASPQTSTMLVQPLRPHAKFQ